MVAPAWLQAVTPPAWYDRYDGRVENYHLPKTDAARKALATVIGTDGRTLLNAIEAATEHRWLREIPAVQILRQVWAEQYIDVDDTLVWRDVQEMPSPAELIASPYDVEARYSTKRSVEWVGYKVHLTETCEADTPHVIVNIETTPATTPDDNMVEVIHASLAPRELLPAEHLVDKGYTDAHVLVGSQREYGVEIVGPVAEDPSWQARAQGGLRQIAVSGRLGTPNGHLSSGSAEPLVVAEHLSAERHGVGGALCPQRLYTVCLPSTMHQGQEGAAHPGTTSAGTL